MNIPQILETASQIWMVLFSCAAIWLLGRRESWRRWGFIVGIIGQIAWFYTSICNRQWGLFLITVWWTYSYAQGIWFYWVKGK